jgi:catechol 2,3-dioxygenase-like lactoylglutathione lyase family enzyme
VAPGEAVTVEVCIDCTDPRIVAEFWTGFLGYTTDDDLGDPWVHLEPPAGLPVLNLQRVPEAKAGKNRLHLDVYVEDPQRWVERAAELGATRVRVNDDARDWYQVMTDPAGNEFCVCKENQPGS